MVTTPQTRTSRYRAVLAQVRCARGEFCEVCRTPARHAHHINPVSETGITADLVFEPGNLMILCTNCHLMMHPAIRKTDWLTIRRLRGAALRG